MIDKDLGLAIATFRFGVIAEFVTGARLAHGQRGKLVEQKAGTEWTIPGTNRTRVSKATIFSWISLYKKAGKRTEGLLPKRRSDFGKYRKVDASLRMAIRDLKEKEPDLTLPVMIKKLRQSHQIKADERINASSVYRFIKNEKLDEVSKDQADRRKFEAEFPNELWQCDVLHGPLVKMEQGPQRKSYLCAIIDDHSRLIVHAQFYLNETLETLKNCLHQAISKRGIPQKFYVDNGSCYRALNLEQILALLGVGLAHSKPYVPQGRGKIERWFGYVRQEFIPLHADKPLSLQELNERLESWVDAYNGKVHGSTKAKPYDRFRKNMECVRPAPDNLQEYFRQIEFRLVRKDRTVQLHGCVFEVPTGLIDKKVELRYHTENPHDVGVYYENRSYGQARIVDAHINAKIGRDGKIDPTKAPEHKTRGDSRQEAALPTRSGCLFGQQQESSEP